MAILDRICSIEGCQKTVFARGWCRAHWTRWRRHGDPLAGGVAAGTLKAALNEAISYVGNDCLFWRYGKRRDGRGVIWIGGKQVAVHRAVCETVHGPQPSPGHEVAHLCGNGHRSCVNPRHLSWATHAENEAHKILHGTQSRGENHGLSVLTEADVAAIRSLRGRATHKEIAAKFGVSKTAVGDIYSGRTWGWL